MDKTTEKLFNDLETRLIQRFNSLLKKMEAKEVLENKRIEKLIDMRIEAMLQRISVRMDTLLKTVDNKKL